MKNLFLLLILLASYQFNIAQVSTEMTSGYEAIDGNFKFYTTEGDFVYTVKLKSRTTLVAQKFEKKSLTLVNTKTFEKALIDDAVMCQMVQVNGMCYVFYAKENRDNSVEFYTTLVDYKNQQLQENKKLLVTAKEGVYKIPYANLCNVFQSEDKSKLLLKYQKSLPSDKRSEQTFGLHVFNTKLENLGGGEILMPFRADELDDMAYGVQNNGHITMSGYHESKNEYHLVSINKDDKSIDIQSLEDQNFSYFYEYALNRDNQKYLVGFYKVGEGAMQMFFSNLKISQKYEVDIPTDMIPYYKDKGKKMNSIMALEAITQEDGGLLVIGQELSGTELYGNWNNGIAKSRASQSSYNFNDYFLIRTNNDGTLKWIKRVPKETINVTNSLGSIDEPMLKILKFHPRLRYHYLYQDGNHFLFFDDEMKEYKGKMLNAYRVDDNSGEGVFTVGFNMEKIGKSKVYHVKPNKIVALGDKKFAAEGFSKKDGDFMILFEIK